MNLRRGNILISAIFISVFLFFLSVALIAANRQDISLTLLADAKLKARHAAEQASTYGLVTMQSDQQWENLLLNKTFTNSTTGDTHWSVNVTAKTLFGVPGTPSNPVLPPTSAGGSSWNASNDKKAHFYEINGIGVCSVYTSEYKLIVEEFPLCDQVPLLESGKKPYLFMLANTTLNMLTPSFTWQALATLNPTQFQNLTTLTGNGGDVYIASTSNATQPVFQDFTFPPPTGAGGLYSGVKYSLKPTAFQLPQTLNANRLVVNGNSVTWQVLPDPNITLGKLTQPTIDGGNITTTQPKLQTIYPPGQKPVLADLSVYKGPSVDYYQINGDFFGDTKSLYCQATHWFYQQSLIQNKEDGSKIATKGGWYHDFAILRATGNTWTVTTDLLKVTDPLSAPTNATCPRPSATAGFYLCEDGSDKIYCLGGYDTYSPSGYSVLEASSNSFSQVVGELPYPSFFFYQNQLRTVQNIAQTVNTSLSGQSQNVPVPTYTNLGFPPLYPNSIANITGLTYAVGTQTYSNTTMVELQSLLWGQGIDLNGVAVVGTDLIGTGRVTIQVVPKTAGAATTNVTTSFLAHYDGERWQLWPSGFSPILRGQISSAPPTVTISQLSPAFSGAVNGTPIAVGGYTSSAKLLRRYQVVATEYP